MQLDAANDFLSPSNLTGVLKSIILRKGAFKLATWLPGTEVDHDKVEMDIAKARLDGMTPAVADLAESPIAPKFRDGASISFEAQEFREKHVLFGADFELIRRLGTDSDRVSQAQLILKYQQDLRQRLENRLEYMRAQALCDGQVTYQIEGTGNTLTVSYNHPAYLEPTLTGTDAWNDLSASTPLDDIVEWTELFDHLPVEGYSLLYGREVERLLRRNEQLRDLALGLWYATGINKIPERITNTQVASGTMLNLIRDHIGSPITMEVYDGGVNLVSQLAAPVAAPSTTVTVRNVADFGPTFGTDSEVQIVDRANRLVTKATVASVNAVTNVVTFTAPLTQSFGLGAEVAFRRLFMPEDCVLMKGNFIPSLEDNSVASFPGFEEGVGQTSVPTTGVGSVVSVRNRYGFEENERRPGMWSVMHKHEKGDPPHAELIIGIKCLPKIDYPEFYVRASVID